MKSNRVIIAGSRNFDDYKLLSNVVTSALVKLEGDIEMAEYATHCIVFWDGKSRGSKHMIDTAYRKELKVIVINYEGVYL